MRRACLLVVATVGLFAIGHPLAAGPREFAATWSVGLTAEADGKILTTLTIRLVNESAVSVVAAGLIVAETPGTEHAGLFPPFDLPAGDAVSLTAEVQVTEREFRQWQSGSQPTLILEFAGDGGVERRPVEMTPSAFPLDSLRLQ